MRETGVNTRLFAGLVSPLAFLRLTPPLMALLGFVFCFVLRPGLVNLVGIFRTIVDIAVYSKQRRIARILEGCDGDISHL